MPYKMTGLSLFLFSLLVGVWFSCSAAKNSDERIRAVEKTDHCEADADNTYEVYIPERNISVKEFPLLVIIDAHGSGKFALSKFKQAADKYPAVLAASNLVKNGFENFEQAIQTMITDLHQKYPAGKTIFMTGFSGGARMALGYALNHQMNGLILCGALGNPKQINAVHCPVISISGMDDFNFIETAQYLFQEELIPGNLKIELTGASHNWPDSTILADALGFIQLSCQDADITAKTRSQLEVYCKSQQVRIDSLKKQGDYLKALLAARNMAFTTPFNRVSEFNSLYNQIKNNSEYTSRLNRLKDNVKYEISLRQPYMSAFMTKDALWWKNEIQTIDDKIKNERDSYTKAMYRRIKAFWGIACYSLSNRAVKEQNANMLNKVLPVYRMLEPDNPDMFYFSAFPYFWKGNNK
ncbi:MAG: hypothetical protein P8X42_05470, partial [Calditrichaceae bacterium]